MKKKIIILAMLATTMILTVTMASAINTADTKNEKEESPLYGIRTNRAISEKIQNLKTKFFGNRLFFLPFQLIKNNINLRDRLQEKTQKGDFTCSSIPSSCKICTLDSTTCILCTFVVVCPIDRNVWFIKVKCIYYDFYRYKEELKNE